MVSGIRSVRMKTGMGMGMDLAWLDRNGMIMVGENGMGGWLHERLER